MTSQDMWSTFERLPYVEYIFKFPKKFTPHFSDCVVAIPLAILLICLRALYERYLMTPIASSIGLTKRRMVPIVANSTLEAAYTKWNRRVPSDQVQCLSSSTSMTVREIDRWFHWRRKQETPSVVYKFSECGWHVIYYSCSFTGALYCLWDKSWLWDTKQYWNGFPNQPVPQGVFWIYQIQTAFYLSLVFSMIAQFDSKKKDRLQMSIHHVVTLFLVIASWSLNYVRIGSVVLLVHDMADPLLMLSKMFWYAKWKSMAEVSFGLTIVVWTFSRLILYPWRVVRSAIFEGHVDIKESSWSTLWVTYWTCVVMLCILQVLHILWTIAILRVVVQKWKGVLQKDVRSETESDSPEEDRAKNDGEKTNGKTKIS